MTRRAGLALLLGLTACRPERSEPPATETVVFHYERSVEGVVRDSTFGEAPLRAPLGQGRLLAGLEECLRALRPGEERTFVLPPEKAYGPRDPAKIETLSAEALGTQAGRLVVGARVYGVRAGKSEAASVVRVEKGRVTLDFNAPDAGKSVTFRLRLVSRER